MAVERPHLTPVDLEHAAGEVGYRHRQTLCWILGQVLDALVDQRHQRRQLVRGGAQPGFQDRDHPLTEQQRVDAVLSHAPPLWARRCIAASSALSRREPLDGQAFPADPAAPLSLSAAGSDADDADQACQPGEVLGVARVEIQIIGMRCRGDQ